MATQVLLVEDVESLGRKGQIVSVKPGYARNYLLPQGVGVLADKKALRMQERLKQEREKQAIVDRQHAEELAAQINGITLTKVVKVDHEGHMYGSVTSGDVLHLIENEVKAELEKRSVQLKHPIKSTGVHTILIKLKEDVTATCTLKVMSEEGYKETLAQGESKEV